MERLICMIVGLQMVSACSIITLPQRHQSVVWSSQSWSSSLSVESLNSHKIVPLLFQPSNFADQLSSADFALLNAHLDLPCVLDLNNSGGQELAVVPQLWLEHLQMVLHVNTTTVSEICQLFDHANISVDQVAGCQNWTLIEAWKRLRIFYDVTYPIRKIITKDDEQCDAHAADHSPQTAKRAKWSTDVTDIMQMWLAKRDPWARREAILPILIVFQQPVYNLPPQLQAELRIDFWMDSK